MGEVYLAEDLSLHRKVALKILPAELAYDQTRMRRFNQEATAAAALNHPHIAHIYEIGEADGVHFIAMEFIDGETLRDKIHRDKLPLTKLLKYLVQTAEALTKAHAAGIVHRDLKPDNIMITRDDYAKILDFGLAKLVEPQASPALSGEPLSEVATAVMPQHSVPGTVMGTAGYMSPEQAQGRVREIDHRSDIFSFGCILFEATTGHKPFEGEDALDSLHKIVHGATPQIKDFNPIAPDQIQRIVQRCLAKDPNKRYHSIKDVALELDEIRHELKGAELEYSVAPASSTVRTQSGVANTKQLSDAAATIGIQRSTSSAEYVVNEIKRHKFGLLAVLATFLILAGGVSFGLYKLLSRRSTFALGPLKIARLTSTGQINLAAITADGKYVFYVQDDGDKESLWMTQVSTSSNVQIAPPADVHYQGITLTHDGSFLYYVRTDQDNLSGGLYRMPALGGTARKLLAGIFGAVTLSPDDKFLAFVRCENCLNAQNEAPGESTLIVANADGSNEKKLAAKRVPNIFSAGGPAWSPDGSVIACGHVHRGGGEGGSYRDILAIRVSDGTEQPITSQRWSGPGLPITRLAWLPDNSGLLVTGVEQGFAARPIWYLPWPRGEARNVSNDFSSYSDLSITSDATVVTAVRSDRVINLWVGPNGDADAAHRITSGAEREDGVRGISWTPDGKIVYCSTGGGTESIWITKTDGTENKQISPATLQNIEPVVSPDGKYVVWAARPAAGWELWRMEIDGSNPTKLAKGATFQDVTRDSKWIFYSPPSAALWKIPLEGGTPTRVIEEAALRPIVSPDGQWLAIVYRPTPEPAALRVRGKMTIAILPIGGGSIAKTFEMPQRTAQIKWTPDGRAIAYIATQNGVSNLWAQPVDGGPLKQLTNFKSEQIFNFAWSPDGKQLALSRGVVNRDVVLITGLK
jgi:serine/threonine protein kinase/Tol biopolymer transport system component